jgi:hypothetical protein
VVKLREDASVLMIEDEFGMSVFTTRFIDKDRTKKAGALASRYALYMNWPEVAKQYQGIIIAPYLDSCRLRDGFFWYYPWDCACGCIWDHTAIESVTYVGETDLPVNLNIEKEVPHSSTAGQSDCE